MYRFIFLGDILHITCILYVYYMLHVCLSFVLIFCFNSPEIIYYKFSDLTEIIDQDFENMSETFFAEFFSPKPSLPKLFITNVLKKLNKVTSVL